MGGGRGLLGGVCTALGREVRGLRSGEFYFLVLLLMGLFLRGSGVVDKGRGRGRVTADGVWDGIGIGIVIENGGNS